MLEIVPDIAQSTHGIRNIFADIRNVPTRPHMVLGMFLLAFPVNVIAVMVLAFLSLCKVVVMNTPFGSCATLLAVGSLSSSTSKR
jgi:hypothetical protein